MRRTQINYDKGCHGLAHHKAKLLLVNENLQDLVYYTAILQNFGYETCPCPTYAEAIERFRSEPFDLVIVSQGSCAFEGRSVLAQAVERDRTTPVLVLGHSADMDCYLEAMQLGANTYGEEPLSPSEVLEQVEKHIRTDREGSRSDCSSRVPDGGRATQSHAD
jgi:DNA-binding response OmpR family regulator